MQSMCLIVAPSIVYLQWTVSSRHPLDYLYICRLTDFYKVACEFNPSISHKVAKRVAFQLKPAIMYEHVYSLN
jgi:hypothetical protein